MSIYGPYVSIYTPHGHRMDTDGHVFSRLRLKNRKLLDIIGQGMYTICLNWREKE